MSHSLIVIMLAIGLGAGGAPGADPVATQADETHPVVVLDTTAGEITLELDREKAPITVDNFLKYVDDKFYDGLIFHRVIPTFMIQGGGFDAQLREKEKTRAPIRNESGNGLSNTRGTIAMARTPDPNSATCQFFINRVDNLFLDDRSRGGYAVFGKVTSGMDVVDKIATAPKATRRGADGRRMDDLPNDPVVIKSARRKAKS
jgi:cyclophilin family peptidyl-prolyl cis-trans isomerase